MEATYSMPVIFVLAFFTVFVNIFTFTCGSSRSMQVEQVHAAEFDVKPGGSVHDFIQNWEGVSCKFTYACQGGTKEQWLMKMLRTADQKEHKCSVERPGQQPSYLFFQQFQVTVTGGKLKEGYAEGEPGRALKPEEYAIKSETNTFSYVEGKFEAKLNKVEVYFVSGNKEL